MISLLQRWYQRHFSQPGTIEFALVLLGAFLIVYYLMWLVGPIVVALCLAFCLDWPTESLGTRFRLSRHLASIIVMILFCSAVISITVLIVPNVIKQGAEFYNSIVSFSLESPNHGKAAPEEVTEQPTTEASAPKSNYDIAHVVPAAAAPMASAARAAARHDTRPAATSSESNTPAAPTVEPSTEQALTQARLEHVATTGPHFVPNLEINRDSEFTLTVRDFDLRIAHELNDIVVKLPEPLPSMVDMDLLQRTVRGLRVGATNKIANLMRTQLMPSVVNAFTWLVYLIVVPIFTFLMLYNKHELQATARQFLLPNNQELMRKFWPSMHQQIAGYIRGKILHIIIITIANTLAFMVLGVNYALLLGVGVGLSVVIPYVGAVIIAVPVVLVAIFQFGFSSELLWVLVIYTIIQLLDSNILTPMLFAKAMSLDAFSILAAIMIFGGLWGFWGVFFAIPLATFIKTLITRWPNADTQPPTASLPPAPAQPPAPAETAPTPKQRI